MHAEKKEEERLCEDSRGAAVSHIPLNPTETLQAARQRRGHNSRGCLDFPALQRTGIEATGARGAAEPRLASRSPSPPHPQCKAGGGGGVRCSTRVSYAKGGKGEGRGKRHRAYLLLRDVKLISLQYHITVFPDFPKNAFPAEFPHPANLLGLRRLLVSILLPLTQREREENGGKRCYSRFPTRSPPPSPSLPFPRPSAGRAALHPLCTNVGMQPWGNSGSTGAGRERRALYKNGCRAAFALHNVPRGTGEDFT